MFIIFSDCSASCTDVLSMYLCVYICISEPINFYILNICRLVYVIYTSMLNQVSFVYIIYIKYYFIYIIHIKTIITNRGVYRWVRKCDDTTMCDQKRKKRQPDVAMNYYVRAETLLSNCRFSIHICCCKENRTKEERRKQVGVRKENQ